MNDTHIIKRPAYAAMSAEIGKVVIGYDEIIALCIRGMLGDGHILLTSLPGLAKTTLANTLASVIHGAVYGRFQMLPDSQASDITGKMVFNQKTGDYVAVPGPIVGKNIFLVDEANRTGPKTNAAVLQPMQEKKVTIDGGPTFTCPELFFVIATRNPIEQEGTYDLPEAMIDRFMAEANMSYVSEDNEMAIVRNTALRKGDSSKMVKPVITMEQILADRLVINEMVQAMPDELIRYIVRLVRSTRPQLKDNFGKVKSKNSGVDYSQLVAVGASVRAQQNIAVCAAAVAFLNDRTSVTPDDVKFVARDILRARIGKSEKGYNRFNADEFISSLLDSVEIVGK